VGANVRPTPGGNDEFYGVREYRPGENPRHIYWRRSAGAGAMVIREMTRVSPPKLLIVVDTQRPDDSVESYIAVEYAIAMAATLVDRAMDAGLPVGLVAWSDAFLTIAPNRAKRHRLELLTALATLPINDGVPHMRLLDKARPLSKRDTTPVLISPRDVTMSLGQSVRGGMVALSSSAAERGKYFEFDPDIDFSVGYKRPPATAPKTT